jgi:hypothetical protein
MKNDAYEEAYNEAREVLHRRGKIVERPTLSDDGARFCRVDGLPLTDRELFKEAWGEGLAEEILREQDVRLPQRRGAASKTNCQL